MNVLKWMLFVLLAVAGLGGILYAFVLGPVPTPAPRDAPTSLPPVELRAFRYLETKGSGAVEADTRGPASDAGAQGTADAGAAATAGERRDARGKDPAAADDGAGEARRRPDGGPGRRPGAAPKPSPPSTPEPTDAPAVAPAGGDAAPGAGAPEGAGPPAGAGAPPRPASPTASGTLDLEADDDADVYVDGRNVGRSPQRGLKYKVGVHRVRFDCFDENDVAVAGRTQAVTVREEAATELRYECPKP